MRFVLLTMNLYENYSLKKFSDEKIAILGLFLSRDVGLNIRPFRDFVLDDNAVVTNSNATYLEKENDLILLGDLYSEEVVSIELKMTQQQFVQLLDDWEEKVCKHKPKTVIIKHENDQFIIETSDE